MKKRILIVGPQGSGSETIAQALEASSTPIRKMANIRYTKKTIIVPNPYLESPWMHKHIIALQQEASIALFLLPIQSPKKSYPPNFSKVFRIPVIGIVTYTLGEDSNERSIKAQRILAELGVKEKFEVNLTDERALSHLASEINQLAEAETS